MGNISVVIGSVIVNVDAGDNVEPGTILMFGGAAAPTGYLLCNGAAVSRTTFAALFTAIGVVFGPGDGSTTFNVPDMRQRFPLGKAASGTGSTLGGTGGLIDHVHTTSGGTLVTELENETFAEAEGPAGNPVRVAPEDHTHNISIPSEDVGGANPPFQTVNFIIKT